MKGHTKGGWRVVDTSRVPYCGDHVADLSNELLVVSDGRLGNALDDAYLIAAAPDLLEALNAVLAFIEGKPNAVEPFGLVREAIGKAAGVRND